MQTARAEKSISTLVGQPSFLKCVHSSECFGFESDEKKENIGYLQISQSPIIKTLRSIYRQQEIMLYHGKIKRITFY